MASNKSLNATCDLNGYLFCKMLKGTLEIEIKVKSTWGKYTMVQNTHTRMEKYPTWEKAQRCHIKYKTGRISHKTINLETEDDASETDTPTVLGFDYPPKGEVKQETKFIGKHCEYCDKCRETYCWCFSSNWEEELLNVENPNSNPLVEIIPSPTARKTRPPCRMVQVLTFHKQQTDQTKLPSSPGEVSTDSGTCMK